MTETALVAMTFAMILCLVQIVEASRRGGVIQLFWPRFKRGYEVRNATRLAALPWVIVFALGAGNLLGLLIEEGERGPGTLTALLYWCAAALLAGLFAHAIGRCRNVWMSLAAVIALACAIAALFVHVGAGWWLVPAGLCLLWTVNGLRAINAELTVG